MGAWDTEGPRLPRETGPTATTSWCTRWTSRSWASARRPLLRLSRSPCSVTPWVARSWCRRIERPDRDVRRALGDPRGHVDLGLRDRVEGLVFRHLHDLYRPAGANQVRPPVAL